MRSANLALRFLLELTALAALAYWGATAPTRVLFRIALAIGAPLVMATFWGMFVAPRARVVLPSAVRMVIGAAALVLAAAALVVRGRTGAGIVLGGLAVLNAIFMVAWKQDHGAVS